MDDLFSPFVLWALWVGVAFFAYQTVQSVRMREDWEITTLKLMSFLYVLGKTLQLWVIGPSIVRWHLADVGFMGFFVGLIPFGYIDWKRALAYGKIGSIILFSGAVFFEVLTLYIQPKEIAPGTYARGDIIDLIIFIVGFIFVSYLLKRLEKKYVPPIEVEVPKRKSKSLRSKKRLFRP